MASVTKRHQSCEADERALMVYKYLLIISLLFVPAVGLATLQVQTKTNDPVARLQEKLNSGEAKLSFDERWGYLPSVLDALNIPRSSQALVFSRTSLQINH